MRRLLVTALIAGIGASTAALAEVGAPTSFSVTVNRSGGTVGATLQVATAGAAAPAASDGVIMNFAVLPPAGPPLSSMATVVRGVPTTNSQFAASFSLAVPNEQLGFKYLAVALPASAYYVTSSAPTGFYEILSFAASLQPSVDVLIAPTPVGPTPIPGTPQPWLWAKGAREASRGIPALSVAGLLALGAALALAGLHLLRRT
jgi:hypothetical protein